MNQTRKEDIKRWADNVGEIELGLFIELLCNAQVAGDDVCIKEGNDKYKGKLIHFDLVYNKRFDDFDIEWQTEKNQYVQVWKYVCMKKITQISTNKFKVEHELGCSYISVTKRQQCNKTVD